MRAAVVPGTYLVLRLAGERRRGAPRSRCTGNVW